MTIQVGCTSQTFLLYFFPILTVCSQITTSIKATSFKPITTYQTIKKLLSLTLLYYKMFVRESNSVSKYKGWLFSVWFGFYKKNNQTEIKKNRTETGSNRPVLVRFVFRTKPVQTSLTRFFGLARFFSGLARLFSGFFRFQAYKTETEPVGFFKILIGLIGFFLRFGFFSYFFPVFSV